MNFFIKFNNIYFLGEHQEDASPRGLDRLFHYGKGERLKERVELNVFGHPGLKYWRLWLSGKVKAGIDFQSLKVKGMDVLVDESVLTLFYGVPSLNTFVIFKSNMHLMIFP